MSYIIGKVYELAFCILSSLICCLNLQKRSAEGGKQGTSLKKLKKDKAGGATAKLSRAENSSVSAAPRVKPELALPSMYSH